MRLDFHLQTLQLDLALLFVPIGGRGGGREGRREGGKEGRRALG